MRMLKRRVLKLLSERVSQGPGLDQKPQALQASRTFRAQRDGRLSHRKLILHLSPAESERLAYEISSRQTLLRQLLNHTGLHVMVLRQATRAAQCIGCMKLQPATYQQTTHNVVTHLRCPLHLPPGNSGKFYSSSLQEPCRLAVLSESQACFSSAQGRRSCPCAVKSK